MRNDPNQTVTSYLKDMTKCPDGIAVIILSAVFGALALIPRVRVLIRDVFALDLRVDSNPLLFLLIPPVLFVSFVWLNAFTKTSRWGTYVNVGVLCWFAAALFFGVVRVVH